MDIKVDSESIREVVKQAILSELGEDQRTLLISAALEHLLKEQSRGQGYNSYNAPSPLQEAFNSAVTTVAREVVAEKLANDAEFKAKVEQIVGQAFIAMEQQDYSDYLGTALSDAFRKRCS